MADTQNTLIPGTRLQSPKREYVIEKVLGQGGFGITYKAVWATKIENVPVKIHFAIKEFFMSDSCERSGENNSKVVYSTPVKNKVEESRRDFISEATRLNSLSREHPSIVRVNEVFETNNTAYYVMEFLEGGSLRNYVRQHGPMSEKEALDIILPVVDAVETLHQSKITHLDIKPDNIMLKPTENGFTPVLIDFGLSKHYDNKGNPTSTIRAVGISAGYAPMEQYTGITTFTPQADVYGLGATLYYLLVGRDPAIASDIRPDIIEEALPANVSPVVRNAILNAMKMFKNERIQSAKLLGEALKSKDSAKKEERKGERKQEQVSGGATKIIDVAGGGGAGNNVINNDNSDHDFSGGGSNYSGPIAPIEHKNRKPLWIGLGVVALIIVVLFIANSGSGDKSGQEGVDSVASGEQYFNLKDEVFKDKEYGKSFSYTGEAVVTSANDTLPNGIGVAKYKDGSVYEGNFHYGVRTGDSVTFRYSNGDKFVGSFEDNHLKEGRYIASDGSYFEGVFKNDQPYRGKWYESNGKFMTSVGDSI